jgi:cytochrome P450 / NADPH-cytochrome P450 reductase
MGGVEFKPSTSFKINFDMIHKDPTEWRNPSVYDPERFNPHSDMYLRPDGKPRNPLSFTPFLGGRRICLGKTFADVVTSFTLPLVLYHFDFEFVDPVHSRHKPNL